MDVKHHVYIAGWLCGRKAQCLHRSLSVWTFSVWMLSVWTFTLQGGCADVRHHVYIVGWLCGR